MCESECVFAGELNVDTCSDFIPLSCYDLWVTLRCNMILFSGLRSYPLYTFIFEHLGEKYYFSNFHGCSCNIRLPVISSCAVSSRPWNPLLSTLVFQKLGFFGTEEEGRYADDIVHSYGFEGVGSSAGSLGCCSDYANSENLDFLNTLGPKFKTLAGVSKKT